MKSKLNNIRKQLKSTLQELLILMQENEEYFKNVIYKDGEWSYTGNILLHRCLDKHGEGLFKDLDKVIENLPKRRNNARGNRKKI